LLYLFSKGEQAELSPDRNEDRNAWPGDQERKSTLMKTAKRTRNVQTNKTNYMSDEVFADPKAHDGVKMARSCAAT
jgi:hypothetical protein